MKPSNLLAPVLGAIADHSAAKKRLLGAFLVFGASAVSAMFFIQHGQWVFAAVLFILAAILALRIGKTAAIGETSNPLVMAGLHNAGN